MPEYATTQPLPGWPTEPEFVSRREQTAPILPPGFTYGVGAQGQLVAVPVREEQSVPATFTPAPVRDVWPMRFLAATPLVGATGAAGYFLLHALAAAEGSLIAIAVLLAMAWAAKGSRGSSGGAVSVTNNVHVNVSQRSRK